MIPKTEEAVKPENLRDLINRQREGHDMDDVWMVGEQLLDMCRHEPHCAALLEADLTAAGMTLSDAAKKIKDYADERHRKNGGGCVCVPPAVAEKLLREFYGLPEGSAQEEAPAPAAPDKARSAMVDLGSFL